MGASFVAGHEGLFALLLLSGMIGVVVVLVKVGRAIERRTTQGLCLVPAASLTTAGVCPVTGYAGPTELVAIHRHLWLVIAASCGRVVVPMSPEGARLQRRSRSTLWVVPDLACPLLLALPLVGVVAASLIGLYAVVLLSPLCGVLDLATGRSLFGRGLVRLVDRDGPTLQIANVPATEGGRAALGRRAQGEA